LIITSAVQAHL
jgi:hypothetical protein